MSQPTTSKPSAWRYSASLEPIKPAAPVMSTFRFMAQILEKFHDIVMKLG
jgi:hypothetical protein